MFVMKKTIRNMQVEKKIKNRGFCVPASLPSFIGEQETIRQRSKGRVNHVVGAGGVQREPPSSVVKCLDAMVAIEGMRVKWFQLEFSPILAVIAGAQLSGKARLRSNCGGTAPGPAHSPMYMCVIMWEVYPAYDVHVHQI